MNWSPSETKEFCTNVIWKIDSESARGSESVERAERGLTISQCLQKCVDLRLWYESLRPTNGKQRQVHRRSIETIELATATGPQITRLRIPTQPVVKTIRQG